MLTQIHNLELGEAEIPAIHHLQHVMKEKQLAQQWHLGQLQVCDVGNLVLS